MPELEILMGGYSINTDQTRLGLCTVTLIRGEVLSIVDVAHFGRRNLLVDSLAAQGIATDDIGRGYPYPFPLGSLAEYRPVSQCGNRGPCRRDRV